MRPAHSYALEVRTDFGYYSFHRLGDDSDEALLELFSDAIDTTPGGSNDIRIVFEDGSGTLYINGEHIDTLDIGGFLEAGDIALFSSGTLGYETHFENFTIWLSEHSAPAPAIPTPWTITSGRFPVTVVGAPQVVAEKVPPTPTPRLITPKDALDAGIEAGEALRRQRRPLALGTLQEAVRTAEEALFGPNSVWDIGREDVKASCGVYQSGITTLTQLDAALWDLDLKRSALLGAINGLGDAVNNAAEVTMFCLSFE